MPPAAVGAPPPFQSISAAVGRAQRAVASGTSAALFLRRGGHTVGVAGGSLFDTPGIVPAAGQRPVVAGAGMYDTTLVTRAGACQRCDSRPPGPGRPHMVPRQPRKHELRARGPATTQGRPPAAGGRGIELEAPGGPPQPTGVMVDTFPATPPM